MKKTLLILLIVGIFLGILQQSGTLTGVRVIDEGMAALDSSLRQYVEVVEAYAKGDEQIRGESLVEILGSSVDTSPLASDAVNEPEVDVTEDNAIGDILP